MRPFAPTFRLLFSIILLCIAAPAATAQVTLEEVFTGVNFRPITDLRHDEAGRIYVAEQRGAIRVIEGERPLGIYLDIRDRVGEGNLEGGIMGFAFHPDYADNGYVFVGYVAGTGATRRTVFSRFSRSADDPPVADPSSEEVLLEVAQPEFNHNGGSIAFGPDGYLYLPLGDGGNSATQAVNGQDPTTLLGSVLRIDVDNPDPGLPYGIPPDNPFAGSDGPERDEIYAYGFRSPWRMSFDAETGDLWLGDVGQDSYEEVSRVVLGGNYGWDVMEALHCYNPRTDCSMEGLMLPVWEYDRSDGRSVTGGYVYRGTALPELVGTYIYGDFISGKVWSLAVDPVSGAVANTELLDADFLLSSFGEGADGELYVLGYLGSVYRLARAAVATEPGAVPEREASLRLAGPNPFRAETALTFALAEAGPARVAVYDVLGREVAVLHDGPATAEAQAVRLAAGALPAGVYVVRLESASGSFAQRVTLLR
ncbi:MAG: PQQ-dependent sugar dehydrogenase [Rhodothermales bacterium]